VLAPAAPPTCELSSVQPQTPNIAAATSQSLRLREQAILPAFFWFAAPQRLLRELGPPARASFIG
jgi:hypothetical protein